MKSVIYSFFFLFLSLSIHAQVGIGTTAPNGALDITSITDGLLIPRVALTSTTLVAPVITGTESELVYNTASIGDVTPGFYYLSTATGPWVRLAGSSGWSITGNNDIVDGTNFLGTTNNVDIAFRRNSTAAGKIGPNSTSFGVGAANTNTANSYTTAFGVSALNSVTTGVYNTAVGYNASRLNTGTYSTAIGAFANENSTGANYNTAVGAQSLQAANGGDNTAIGLNALQDNTAAGNSALGHLALTNNTSGTGNVAMGFSALDANLTGTNNTAVGYNASGTSNASNVTTFGYNAGAALTAQDNTAIGSGAMDGLTSAASRENTAVGFNALGRASAATVSHNTALGHNAALSINSSFNTAIGHNALSQATSGANTAVGDGAMEQGNSQHNTAVGYRSLFNTSGNNNVSIGYGAAEFHNNGNNSVVIGYQAAAQGRSNAISIGYQASANGNNQVTLGNGSIGVLRCQVTSITALSDRRDKDDIVKITEGIEFIKQLKPVTYTWNTRDKSKVGTKAVGFIAQDLLDLQLKSSIGENLDLVSYDNPEKLEARYGNLLPVIVKGIQEQQTLIEKLQKQNEELLKINALFLERLDALEALQNK